MKCIIAGCKISDAEGELDTGMCSPHYEILTGHGRAMLTGMGRHSEAARQIANLIPNELAFYDADALLPKQTRLLLAQPLNRFPFSGSGRINAALHLFRSDSPSDGHGSIAAYMGIVDLLGKEVTYHNERATAQAAELSQLKADIGAMRRLFGIEGIVQMTIAPAETPANG